jgi:hypothetical protein
LRNSLLHLNRDLKQFWGRREKQRPGFRSVIANEMSAALYSCVVVYRKNIWSFWTLTAFRHRPLAPKRG